MSLSPDCVALALEPIERQRHRSWGHPHVAREGHHCRRFDFIEMVEDACLVAAEETARGRVSHVPRVAGEVDARIQRHHRRHRLADAVPDRHGVAQVG